MGDIPRVLKEQKNNCFLRWAHMSVEVESLYSSPLNLGGVAFCDRAAPRPRNRTRTARVKHPRPKANLASFVAKHNIDVKREQCSARKILDILQVAHKCPRNRVIRSYFDPTYFKPEIGSGLIYLWKEIEAGSFGRSC